MTIHIEKFDFRNTTEDVYAAFNQCRNKIRLEQLPDDPPIPLDETIRGFQNFPDYIEVIPWMAKRDKDENDLLGYGLAQFSREDNLHMLQFVINVLPEFRKQGLGKEFLSRIVDIAQQENRSLLITSTMARIPAGEAFMNRIGAERGLETHTNQLTIADLDPNLVHQWQERASERGADFEIGLWEGIYPEEDIESIVELYDLINQQPFGDLDIEDFTMTADHIRQDEKNLFARGYERWTLFVREKQTGKFAGYTEVFWNPNRPDIVGQGITGVFPQYRNKGLGRWLKAAMLDKILKERSQAKFVRTGNADMNAPMLKINNELGFQPYIAECVWQVQTDKVVEYLSA